MNDFLIPEDVAKKNLKFRLSFAERQEVTGFKKKVIVLTSYRKHGSTSVLTDPWNEVSLPKPRNYLVECHALSDLAERNLEPKENEHIESILLDVDAISQSFEKIEEDRWAQKAWRSTLSNLVSKCLKPGLHPPSIIAYTREPHLEMAVLAMRVGARDFIKLSKLNDLFLDSDPSLSFEKKEFHPALNPSPNTASVLDPESSSTAPGSPTFQKIPRHAIPFPIEGLEGDSLAICTVRDTVRKVAPLESSVLLVGPTGSGKERTARALHHHSLRSQGPFVAIACGALSPHLIESELFGHIKGAFTGAHTDKTGLLATANGGTLFLDEISELNLEAQVKLLRALQEKVITPVGSQKSQTLDIRVIASTQEDLSARVQAGLFREDLLYRIKVLEIHLPSLFERRGDLPELTKSILRKFARKNKKPFLKVSEKALEKMLLYRWPGNIRELENVLEHASALCWSSERSEISVEDLPTSLQLASLTDPEESPLKEAVRKFEKEYILRTIRRLGGSKENAAEALGLSLASLYRKIA